MLKGELYFIVSATMIWVSSLLVTAWDFLQLQRAMYQFGLVNAVGLALFVAGVCIRLVAKRTLAKNYSYILKNQQSKGLVTRGVYRFVRHPIYLAGILYIMGTPLVFGSIYGFFVAFGIVPCFLYRIGIEEKMLIREFGDAYVEYRRRTKKLIPYVY